MTNSIYAAAQKTSHNSTPLHQGHFMEGPQTDG
jgi:hypothetical protein